MDMQKLKMLREQTGVGIADCKVALEESGGDMESAVKALRERGKLKAFQKSERTATEGIIGTYVHANGKIASSVVLQCETDFVARSDAFQKLARDLAMHVTSENPQYLSPEDIPQDVLAQEREFLSSQLRSEGKPEELIEKILPGKLQKYFEATCLLEQFFIKDEEKKIKELLSLAVLQLGENIHIREFHRIAL